MLIVSTQTEKKVFLSVYLCISLWRYGKKSSHLCLIISNSSEYLLHLWSHITVKVTLISKERGRERLRQAYLQSISTWLQNTTLYFFNELMRPYFRMYWQVRWKMQAISTVLDIRTDAGKVTGVPEDVLIRVWTLGDEWDM